MGQHSMVEVEEEPLRWEEVAEESRMEAQEKQPFQRLAVWHTTAGTSACRQHNLHTQHRGLKHRHRRQRHHNTERTGLHNR